MTITVSRYFFCLVFIGAFFSRASFAQEITHADVFLREAQASAQVFRFARLCNYPRESYQGITDYLEALTKAARVLGAPSLEALEDAKKRGAYAMGNTAAMQKCKDMAPVIHTLSATKKQSAAELSGLLASKTR